MDMSIAASMFDDQPIYDGYTGDLLFIGQPLNYDGSVRDSVASWRQSLSATKIIGSDRGIIKFGDEMFVTGRVVQDFFQGDVVRENVILHPCDGLYRQGAAVNFLTTPVPTSVIPFYGGVTWRKSSLDEKESPELHNICDIYFSTTEDVPEPSSLILATTGTLYRVRSIEAREGGFTVAVCSDLGVDAFADASYVGKGSYNPTTDSATAGAPIAVRVIVELNRTNFKFVVADTAKYAPSDRIITLRSADVATPEAEDLITISGTVYRVISAHLDEAGDCWELHSRRQ